jgi:hypothetical protein
MQIKSIMYHSMALGAMAYYWECIELNASSPDITVELHGDSNTWGASIIYEDNFIVECQYRGAFKVFKPGSSKFKTKLFALQCVFELDYKDTLDGFMDKIHVVEEYLLDMAKTVVHTNHLDIAPRNMYIKSSE